jgi:hypothetical protein
VRKYLAKRTLRRRIIALAAAYAIALSSLIASFSAGRAAAEAAALPGGIICHSAVAGQPAPSDETNSRICADCCCVGCLMLMMTAVPPATAVAVTQSASRISHLSAIAVVAGAPNTKSHRSRAPPLGA